MIAAIFAAVWTWLTLHAGQPLQNIAPQLLAAAVTGCTVYVVVRVALTRTAPRKDN